MAKAKLTTAVKAAAKKAAKTASEKVVKSAEKATKKKAPKKTTKKATGRSARQNVNEETTTSRRRTAEIAARRVAEAAEKATGRKVPQRDRSGYTSQRDAYDAKVRQSYGERSGKSSAPSTFADDVKKTASNLRDRKNVGTSVVRDEDRDSRVRQSWGQRNGTRTPVGTYAPEKKKEKQKQEDFVERFRESQQLSRNEKGGVNMGSLKENIKQKGRNWGDPAVSAVQNAEQIDAIMRGKLPGYSIPEEKRFDAAMSVISSFGKEKLSSPYIEEIFNSASAENKAKMWQEATRVAGHTAQTDRWEKVIDSEVRRTRDNKEKNRITAAKAGVTLDTRGNIADPVREMQWDMFKKQQEDITKQEKAAKFLTQWGKENGYSDGRYILDAALKGVWDLGRSTQSITRLPILDLTNIEDENYLRGAVSPLKGIIKNPKTIGDYAQNILTIGKNIGGSIYDIIMLTPKLGYAGLNAINPDVDEYVDGWIQRNDNSPYFKEMSDMIGARMEVAGANVGRATKEIGNIEQMVIQMAPPIALSFIVGPEAALAASSTAFGVTGAGMYSQAAIDSGASVEDAIKYGIVAGAAEMGTEAIFPMFRGFGGSLASSLGGRIGTGRILFSDTVRALQESKFANSMAARILRTTIYAGGEATEEMIMEIIDPYIQRATFNPEAEAASLAEIGMAGLYGAAVSAVLHVPIGVMNTAQGIKRRGIVSDMKRYNEALIKDRITTLTNMAEMGIISEEEAQEKIDKIYKAKDAAERPASLTRSFIRGTEGKTTGFDLSRVYSSREEANAAVDNGDTSAVFMENGEAKVITSSAGMKTEGTLTPSEKAQYTEKSEKVKNAKNEAERTGYQLNVRPEVIEEVSKLSSYYGKDIVFFDDKASYEESGLRGYAQGGKIYLNIANDTPAQTVIAHEMAHEMKGAKAFDFMLDEVKRFYKDTYEAKKDELRDFGYKESELDEEVLAHFVEQKLMVDEAWINSFISANGNKGAQFGNAVIRGINNIIQKGFGGKEQRFLANVRTKWLKALREESRAQNRNVPAREAAAYAKGEKHDPHPSVYDMHVAKQMEKEGRSAEEITKATGWYKRKNKQDKTPAYIWAVADKLSPETAYDFNKSFAQQIEDYLQGKFHASDTFLLGDTPELLQEIGLDDLPVTLGIYHFLTAINYHDGHSFTVEEIKNLPEAIERPLAVIRSTSPSHEKDTVMLVVRIGAAVKDLIAIRISGNGRMNGERIRSNSIATFYSTSAIKQEIDNAVKTYESGENSIFFFDTQRLRNEANYQLERVGTIMSERLQKGGFINNIIGDYAEGVKGDGKKKFTKGSRDAAYMAAVEEGNMEEAQRLVDEAAKAAGYVYARNTRNKLSPRNNDADYYMFVDTTVRQNTTLDHYGKYKYYANSSGAIHVDNIKDDLREAWVSFAEENNLIRDITDKDLNPPDIVDTAGVWENMDFVGYLFDNGFFSWFTQDEYPAILTDDGLIVFGDDYKRIKSADPVTYDEDGNVIPLSERFSDGNDIRYAKGQYKVKNIEQEYTSANTSINSNKLPAIFRMVNFEKGSVNLDYGGGKFDNATEYLHDEFDATNLVYDPYNRSEEHNDDVIRQIEENGGADTVTCSNVLNVIKEPEVRQNILQNIQSLLKEGGTVYITVYEGKGDSKAHSTKAGYQLNRKTNEYIDEVKNVFPNAERRGKLIVATKTDDIRYAKGKKRKAKFKEGEKVFFRRKEATVMKVNDRGLFKNDPIEYYLHFTDGHNLYAREDEIATSPGPLFSVGDKVKVGRREGVVVRVPEEEDEDYVVSYRYGEVSTAVEYNMRLVEKSERMTPPVSKSKKAYNRGKEVGKRQAEREQDRVDRATLREFDKMERERAKEIEQENRKALKEDEATMREYDDILKEIRKNNRESEWKIKREFKQREKELKDNFVGKIKGLTTELRSWKDTAEKVKRERLKRERQLETEERRKLRAKQRQTDNSRRRERRKEATRIHKEAEKADRATTKSLFKRNRGAIAITRRFREEVLSLAVDVGAFNVERGIVYDYDVVLGVRGKDGYVLKKDRKLLPDVGLMHLAEQEGFTSAEFQAVYADLIRLKYAKYENEKAYRRGNIDAQVVKGSMHKRKDVVEYIQSLDITAPQKQFLYFDAMRYPDDKKSTFTDGGEVQITPEESTYSQLLTAIDDICLSMFSGANPANREAWRVTVGLGDLEKVAKICFPEDSDKSEDLVMRLSQAVVLYEDEMISSRMAEATNLLIDNPKEKDAAAQEISKLWNVTKRYFLAESEAYERMSARCKTPLITARFFAARNAQSVAREFISGHGVRNIDGVKTSKSLTEIMKPALKDEELLKDLTLYVNVRHNIDRMKAGKGFMEISEEECREIMSSLEEDKRIVEIADDIVEYGRSLLRLCVESGNISEADYEYFTTKYPYYVPTFRLQENEVLDRNGRVVRRSTKVIKESTKSYADVIPLYDQFVRRTIETVTACKKQQLATQLAACADRAGVDFIGDIKPAKPSKSSKDEYIFGIGEIEKDGPGSLDRETGNTIPLYIDGVKYLISVNDDGLLYGWDSLTRKVNEIPITTFLRKSNNVRRGLLTQYNPTFPITNGIKDTIDMYLVNQHAHRLPKFQLVALKKMASASEEWQEYLARGASHASIFEYANRDTLQEGSQVWKTPKKGLRKLKNVPATFDALNFLVEQWPRFTVYLETVDRLKKESAKPVRSRKKVTGERWRRYSDEEIKTIAAYRAADATVNFGRSGTAVKYANTYGFTFLNAGVQGADRYRRAIMQVKGDTKRATLINVLGLMIKAVGVGMGTSIAAGLIYGGDDDEINPILRLLYGAQAKQAKREFAEMADHIKTGYLVFKIPDTGYWVKIPMGRLASFINGFQYYGMKVFKGEIDAMDMIAAQWDLATNTILPPNPLTNNILQPVIDVARNKDWLGYEIVSQWDDAGEGFHWTEKTEETSKIAEGIGKALHEVATLFGEREDSPLFDVSPIKIDYIAKEYLGSWHDFVAPYINAISNGDMNLANMVLSSLSKGVDRFRLDPIMSNRLATEYYDLKNYYERMAEKEENDTPYAVAVKAFKEYGEELKPLRDELKTLSTRTDMPPDKKLMKMRAIKRQMNEIYRQGIIDAKSVYSFANVNYYGKEENSDIYKEWATENKDISWQINQLSDSGKEKWNAAKGNNISEEDFLDAYNYFSKVKSSRDVNGKQIKGQGKKDKFISHINQMDLSAKQKLELYRILGEYSEKKGVPSFTDGKGSSTVTVNPNPGNDISKASPPVSGGGRISSGFGWRNTGIQGASTYHQAIDIAAPAGTAVGACLSGTVSRVTSSDGYGNSVEVVTTDSLGREILFKYSHLQNFGVKVGQTLTQGQKLGEVGSTGVSSGNHLDLKMAIDGKWVDASTVFDVAGSGIVDGGSYVATTQTGGSVTVASGGSSGGSGGRRSGGKSSGGSSSGGSTVSYAGERTRAVTEARQTAREASAKRSSERSSSGSSAVTSKPQVASRDRGTVLPTAAQINEYAARARKAVTGQSTKAPSYAAMGAVMPTAKQVVDYARVGYGAGTTSTRRTAKTKGRFWDENVLG